MALGVILVYKCHFGCAIVGGWNRYQEGIIRDTRCKNMYPKWELISHSDSDLGQGSIKIWDL